MTKKAKVTLILNLLTSLLVTILGFQFGWFYFLPLSFIATPLLNIQSTYWIKLKLTFIQVLFTTVVMVVTGGLSLGFSFLLIPMLLSGLAAVLILSINVLINEELKLNWLGLLVLFLFSFTPLILVDYLRLETIISTKFLFGFLGVLLWQIIVSLSLSLSLNYKTATI